MSSIAKKSIWYGILETSKARTVVLRDNGLPEPLEGRLYLYNSDRNQIVEYVENIVSSKLRELTAEEIKALDNGIEKKYTEARNQFLSENESLGKVLDIQKELSDTKSSSKAVVLEVVDEVVDLADESLDEIDENIDWEDDEEEQSA